jgi:hypothetical protein
MREASKTCTAKEPTKKVEKVEVAKPVAKTGCPV